MYGQPLNLTASVKFLSDTVDSHLNMKLHAEKAFFVSKMNITRLNSTNTTLVIRLYKIFVRQHRD